MTSFWRSNSKVWRSVLFAVALFTSPRVLAHTDPPAIRVAIDSLPSPTHRIDIQLTETDFETPFDWEGYPERSTTLREAEAFSQVIKTEMHEQIENLGEVAFRKKVETDKATWTFPGWGKGEVTCVDGIFHARVVHDQTRVSFYFLEKGEIAPDSKHLQRIVARQHIDAGPKRRNGSKIGRDTVLAWTRDHRVVESQYYPRNPLLSPAWFKDYWLASYLKPTRVEKAFGVVCAGLQVGAASCLLGAKYYMNPEAGFDTSVLIMSALWGYYIGAYNSTYRNIIYRGSERSKFTKMWGQSMLFAWSLYVYSEGVWTLINVTAPAFYQVHSNAVVSSWLHNQARRAWYLFPEARNHHREAVGTQKVLGWDTGIKKASIEQQGIYLVPFTIKLAGLVGVGTVATLALGGDLSYKVDGGTLALLASVPIAQAGALAYARHRHYPTAEEYAGEFRNYWGKVATLAEGGAVGAGYLNGVVTADQIAQYSRAALSQMSPSVQGLPENLVGWMARTGRAAAGAAKNCAQIIFGLPID